MAIRTDKQIREGIYSTVKGNPDILERADVIYREANDKPGLQDGDEVLWRGSEAARPDYDRSAIQKAIGIGDFLGMKVSALVKYADAYGRLMKDVLIFYDDGHLFRDRENGFKREGRAILEREKRTDIEHTVEISIQQARTSRREHAMRAIKRAEAFLKEVLALRDSDNGVWRANPERYALISAVVDQILSTMATVSSDFPELKAYVDGLNSVEVELQRQFASSVVAKAATAISAPGVDGGVATNGQGDLPKLQELLALDGERLRLLIKIIAGKEASLREGRGGEPVLIDPMGLMEGEPYQAEREKARDVSRLVEEIQGRLLELAELQLQIANTKFEIAKLKGEAVADARPDYSEAIKTCERIIREYPAYERLDEVIFRLAALLISQDKEKQGASYLVKLTKGYPSSKHIPMAFMNIGDYYLKHGLVHAAITNYMMALSSPGNYRRSPFDASPSLTKDQKIRALTRLAACFASLGDFPSALSRLKDAEDQISHEQK